jgi:NADH:ubiquinone oxidoreductase subunit 3 (subunit A)
MGFQEWIKGFTYKSGFENMTNSTLIRSSTITDLKKSPVLVNSSSNGWNFIFMEQVLMNNNVNIMGPQQQHIVDVYNGDQKVGRMKWIAATLAGYIHSTVQAISPDSFEIKIGYRLDFLEEIEESEEIKDVLYSVEADVNQYKRDIQTTTDNIEINKNNIETNIVNTDNIQNSIKKHEDKLKNVERKLITRMNKQNDKTNKISGDVIRTQERVKNIETLEIEPFTNTNPISGSGYNRLIGVQQHLLNITKQEKDRLDNTSQNYNDQDENRNKMQMIMLSEKDKQNKYMLLAVIFVVVFVIAFFFTYIQHVKKQKSIWFDIIMLLLIISALIYAITVYTDIQNRDPNNFSKLGPTSDNLIVVASNKGDGKHGIKYGIAETTDLQGGGCKGDACCGPGSYWIKNNNPELGKCGLRAIIS